MCLEPCIGPASSIPRVEAPLNQLGECQIVRIECQQTTVTESTRKHLGQPGFVAVGICRHGHDVQVHLVFVAKISFSPYGLR